MRIIKLSVTILAIGLFLMACNTNQPQQIATVEPYPDNGTLTDPNDDWAKDNLDLQRVGNLLERTNSPQEFETYLNSDDGINNLDLNGDGYADYISVDEFGDRGGNERGLSLFMRFGPDLIQEIATIVFHRDDPRWPGARILVTGNEQLYGDNNYYETNWADRSLGIVNALFGDRNDHYRSPYYYDNYPRDYRVYEVVETPVYRTRIERIYPAPVFIFTTTPSISKVKIKSPHYGKWMDKVYAKLAKPTKEQMDFRQNNPGRPHRDKDDKRGKTDDRVRSDDNPHNDRKFDDHRGDRKFDDQRGGGSKPAKEKDNGKHGDKGGKGGGKKDH